MNRRKFFGLLAGVPIAAALVENPLGRKIFLPPRGGWTWRDYIEPPAPFDLLLSCVQAYNPGSRPQVLHWADTQLVIPPYTSMVWNVGWRRNV
jgi:hypothetical protein